MNRQLARPSFCDNRKRFEQAFFVLMFLLIHVFVSAQQYDLLIKNGTVIDPKNHINAKKIIAVRDGKIALIADDLPVSEAKKTIDATGMYVVPGLIDIHTH